MKSNSFPRPFDHLLGAIVLACLIGLAFMFSRDASAQTTCPAAPTSPVARDAVRFTLTPPTTWVQGGPIVGPLTYTLYELVGTTWTVRCTTSSVTFGQTGLAVGDHTWAVTAKTPASFPANVESVRSNNAGRTIEPAPLTPNAPITFTVEGAITISGTITLTPNP